MRRKRADTVEINFHISSELFTKLNRLQEAGLSLSAIARLAIRKCHNQPLDDDQSDNTLPKRLLLYIHPEEARLLDELSSRYGERSRASSLRRLIATYLRVNASAINDLF